MGYSLQPSECNPIERFHKTIRSLLKAKKANRENDWEKRLPTLILAYNATQHFSTLCSPARLFLCREANLSHLSLFPKFKLDSLHAIPLPLLCAIFTELRARAHKLNPNALETLLSHRLQAICNCVSMSRVLFSDKTYLAFTIFSNNQKLFFQKYH